MCALEIFSLTRGLPSTLLMVDFVEQMFLILTKPI